GGRVDRRDRVEAESPGRVVGGPQVPAAVENVLDGPDIVAHHAAVLAAEHALHELLEPGEARDAVDAAEFPTDERIEIGSRAALERLLELAAGGARQGEGRRGR